MGWSRAKGVVESSECPIEEKGLNQPAKPGGEPLCATAAALAQTGDDPPFDCEDTWLEGRGLARHRTPVPPGILSRASGSPYQLARMSDDGMR